MATVTAAPPGRADAIDDLIDQVLSPLVGTAAGTVDWDGVLSGLSSAGDPMSLAGSPAPDAAGFDLPALLDRLIYTPIHAGLQDWITSDLGQKVDGLINTVSGSHVIGNGTAGTAQHPDGGAGGWLFGDGGAGWDSTEAGVVGGDGGAAGIFGTGGAGGDGGVGAAGGAGGVGGINPTATSTGPAGHPGSSGVAG